MSETTGSELTKLVVGGVALVAFVETMAVVMVDQRHVLWLSGVAVAIAFVAAWRVLLSATKPEAAESFVAGPDESLRRWIAQTETLVRWADRSRADWDRHLRPKLAREFLLTTGQRQTKDAAALQATGRMMFGDDLWQWVDPGNVTPTGRGEPAPGRAVLDEILQRLERP